MPFFIANFDELVKSPIEVAEEKTVDLIILGVSQGEIVTEWLSECQSGSWRKVDANE